MKTIQNSMAILCIIFLTLTSSCKKDNNVIGTPASGATKQLSRIDQDADNYATFSYNSDGLLSSYVSVHNKAVSNFSTVYGTDKKALSGLIDGLPSKFIYDGSKLIKVERYGNPGDPTQLTDYVTYSYTNNQITTADYYARTGNSPLTLFVRTTSVYNTSGDISNQKTYYQVGSNLQLGVSIMYEYDNKPSPLTDIFDFTSFFQGGKSAHNVTKSVSYDGSNNVTETDTYAYTYNTNNYPLTVTETVVKANQADKVTVSKFIYK